MPNQEFKARMDFHEKENEGSGEKIVDFETTSFMDEPFGTDVFFEKGSGYKVIILSIYFTFPFYSWSVWKSKARLQIFVGNSIEHVNIIEKL